MHLTNCRAYQRQETELVANGFKAIAQGANSLELDFIAMRELISCGQRELEAISPLKSIIAHQTAWSRIQEDIKTAVDSGTKWRKPRRT